MSRVSYGTSGNMSRIIPAPLCSIQKTYTKRGDGSIIGKIYNITLTGTIIAWMGSPQSNGTFWTAGGYPSDESIGSDSRLSAIQRKQEALRDLFSNEGQILEIQALDATAAVKCNPRLMDISFSEGIWYDRCEYTITLETDELYGATGISEEDTFPEYISGFDESWSFETDETPEGLNLPRTYRISHSLSATGKRFYQEDGTLLKEAWQAARDYLLPYLGLDAAFIASSGVSNLPSYYGGYNHVRNDNRNETGGTYEITENWILASGTALEDFTVEKTKNLDSPYTSVNINGTITGLEQRDSNLGLTVSKYTNANTKYTAVSGQFITRAQTYSGLSLNVVPLRETIGMNPVGGTITYSYEYDDRPVIITGAKSANVTVNDTLAGQMYASIFILGRALGPIMQDLGTTPESKRTLSIEAIMDPISFGGRTQAEIQTALNSNPRLTGASATEISTIIAAAKPSSYTTIFQGQPQESWNPITGNYSYNLEWSYE